MKKDGLTLLKNTVVGCLLSLKLFLREQWFLIKMVENSVRGSITGTLAFL